MRAVKALERAAIPKGYRFDWVPCKTIMTFANSASATLNWCVIVHFPSDPPLSTTIDVHEEGSAPILFSLGQMANLGVDLNLRRGRLAMTCPAFGYYNDEMEISTSRHLVAVSYTHLTLPTIE